MWHISATRASADMALRFVMSCYPDLVLDQLMAQQASAERLLQAEVGRIPARASYMASFALHNEFYVERMDDDRVVPPDDFGLLLDDPLSSSEESSPYTDEDAGLANTGTSMNPEPTEEESAVVHPGTGAI